MSNKFYHFSGPREEDWTPPVREWLGKNASHFRYREVLVHPVDGVIEIGMSVYQIDRGFQRTFSLQVDLKLIDPKSGEVLGRSWASGKESVTDYYFFKHASLDGVFANQSTTFKKHFIALGKQLVGDGLKDLGFLAHEAP